MMDILKWEQPLGGGYIQISMEENMKVEITMVKKKDLVNIQKKKEIDIGGYKKGKRKIFSLF